MPYPLSPPFADLDRELATHYPSSVLFTGEDALEIDSNCSAPGVVLTVAGTMLGEGLTLIPFSFQHLPNSDRSLATSRYSIASGWLQTIRVSIAAGTPGQGQCYVAIRRCRGLTPVSLVTATIHAGYLTAIADLWWPGQDSSGPLAGPGRAYYQFIGTVGAGLDGSFVMPPNTLTQIVSFSGILTTSAAAANRLPRFYAADGSWTLYGCFLGSAITAGLAVQCSWGAGAGGPVTGDVVANGQVTAPIPNDFMLHGGMTVGTTTGAIQAADVWTHVILMVREWIEG